MEIFYYIVKRIETYSGDMVNVTETVIGNASTSFDVIKERIIGLMRNVDFNKINELTFLNDYDKCYFSYKDFSKNVSYRIKQQDYDKGKNAKVAEED